MSTGPVRRGAPTSLRCLHREHPTSRQPAAIANAARALRAAGRKAKLKESSYG